MSDHAAIDVVVRVAGVRPPAPVGHLGPRGSAVVVSGRVLSPDEAEQSRRDQATDALKEPAATRVSDDLGTAREPRRK